MPCDGNNSKIENCPEIEKQSLLSFKHSLHDPENSLPSWNHDEVDCCKWEGVRCSNLTGHVRQLHLQNSDLSGKLSPTLLNLKHLKYLDLSQNNFDGKIPSFIGSLTSLEYLNLSSDYFQGKIPHNIGNLSNLHTLSLDKSYSLEVDSLAWLSRLSKLEYLNMNGVNLNRASNWAQQVINKLPSLVDLYLSACSLNDNLPLMSSDINNITSSKLAKLDLSSNNLQDAIHNSIANLTSLTTLDLSYNHLSGNISRGISNLCKLQNLDLSDNQLSGPLTLKFGEFKSLRILNLRSNSLSGVLPRNLGNLSSLKELELEDNKFTGNLPESIGQLSNLEILRIENNKMEGVVTETHFSHLSRLEYLFASGNNLTLRVSPNWIPPFKLLSLSMGSWNLMSSIPAWLDTQKMSIEELDLSNTGIYGKVPNWLYSMRFLNLSHNQLNGKIPLISDPIRATDYYGLHQYVYLAMIFNMPPVGKWQYVYLGSNKFSGELPRVGKWLTDLDLSNNSFSGDLFGFLCNKTTTHRLHYLHLGGNQLTGELPNCFMKLSSLATLNLANNNLSGKIPKSIGFLSGLRTLDLNGNNFSGDIPMQHFNFLIKMDLSHNNLTGNLTNLIVTYSPMLMILILKSNKLSGQIPSSICQLSSLQILDLSNNMFSGMIPSCVDRFTAMTTKNSDDEGTVLIYYSSLVGASIESASMTTKGMELTYDTILGLVTGIDLSKNNLSGHIPKEITSLVELRTLNLSRNHLTGPIPRSIGNMTQLESLDFSINSLSGDLPISFTAMSYLSYLNVSHNNLTGRIPESTQLQGFNESSFIGNNLCGPPLTIPCSNITDGKAPAGTVRSKDEKTNKTEIEWLYVFISLGYAVGLSGFLTTLYLKRSWREAYYDFFEKIWDDAYVYLLIKWRRVARARASGPNM